MNWIRVEEQRPRQNEPVLAVIKNFDYRGIVRAHWNGKRWEDEDYDHIEATHWQPMPVPKCWTSARFKPEAGKHVLVHLGHGVVSVAYWDKEDKQWAAMDDSFFIHVRSWTDLPDFPTD